MYDIRRAKQVSKSKVFTQSEWQATINQKPKAKKKEYQAKWSNKQPKRDGAGRVVK